MLSILPVYVNLTETADTVTPSLVVASWASCSNCACCQRVTNATYVNLYNINGMSLILSRLMVLGVLSSVRYLESCLWSRLYRCHFSYTCICMSFNECAVDSVICKLFLSPNCLFDALTQTISIQKRSINIGISGSNDKNYMKGTGQVIVCIVRECLLSIDPNSYAIEHFLQRSWEVNNKKHRKNRV